MEFVLGVVKVGRYLIFHRVFCFANISDWSNHKKPANITVTSRICFFGYPRSKFVFFVFHTKRTRQMDPQQSFILELSVTTLKGRRSIWNS